MVKIEVSGITIEAEDWKAARRLVLKEEKRQEKERQAQHATHEKALIMAWAAVGKLSTRCLSYSDFFFNEHADLFVKDGILKIESPNGEQADVHLTSSRKILGGVIDAQGRVLAMKSQYKWSDKPGDTEESWEAYGAEQGEHAVLTLPRELSEQLDKIILSFLGRKAA